MAALCTCWLASKAARSPLPAITAFKICECSSQFALARCMLLGANKSAVRSRSERIKSVSTTLPAMVASIS
ncbi:hypothetical protein D3C84_1244470 [compost metagenome]